MLTQRHEEVPLPVAFYSRKLRGAELNYSTTEKELLAIVNGLQHYRAYVGHGPLTIYSDHSPLTWLSRVRTHKERLLRWSLSLSELV